MRATSQVEIENGWYQVPNRGIEGADSYFSDKACRAKGETAHQGWRFTSADQIPGCACMIRAKLDV
jgi:hypothetical protein